MINAKINNEINLTYPEGYNEMNEAELSRYFGTPDNRWGVFDPGRHIVISVGWNKPGFFSSMGDAESFLLKMTSRMRRTLLNYQVVNEYELKIASKDANGIRFEYRVNDSVSVHSADLVVFKYKSKFYAIQFAARKNKADEYRREFLELLQSITLDK